MVKLLCHLTLTFVHVFLLCVLYFVINTMLFREDLLLPLESAASLYHRVEEGHLKYTSS